MAWDPLSGPAFAPQQPGASDSKMNLSLRSRKTRRSLKAQEGKINRGEVGSGQEADCEETLQ